MFGTQNNPILPNGDVSASRLRDMGNTANALAMSSGHHFSNSFLGITPAELGDEFAWVQFGGNDGLNGHSWDELETGYPYDPKIKQAPRQGRVGGGSSSSGSSGSSGSSSSGNRDRGFQIAYDFNFVLHSPGTRGLIKRISADAWGIVYAAGSSSSDVTFVLDCAAGTIRIGKPAPVDTSSSGGKVSSSGGNGGIETKDGTDGGGGPGTVPSDGGGGASGGGGLGGP